MSTTHRPRILLTGDDGYQSHGTRLLAHFLREGFDLTIAGTVAQQSGVGGKVSIATGFNWGRAEVDGIPAFWVEGTPVDTIELLANFEIEPFDVVISGINWGANLGATLANSGTVNAAIGSLVRQLTKQAIAVSWDLPPEFYTMHHDKEHSIVEYLEYPGKVIDRLLRQCIKEKLWGAQFLNINLPQKPTTQVKVTRLIEDVRQVYDQPFKHSGESGHFSYADSGRVFSKTLDQVYDVRALTDGYISISPCLVNLVHEEAFQKLQKAPFQLQ